MNANINQSNEKLEDKTLQEELDCYRDYARQTRHHLLPGVW